MKIDDKKMNSKSVCAVFAGNSLCFSDMVLQLVEAEFQCVACLRTASVNDLLLMGKTRSDAARLIVVDESMSDGLIKVLPRLREAFPMANIALAYRQRAIALRLVNQFQANPTWGAIGYLPMNINIDGWLPVVRLLMSGEYYHPVELYPNGQSAPRPTADQPHAGEPDTSDDIHLTTRELQVLKSAASGMQNKNIADKLELSQHTIKLHMHHIIAKLGVNNRTEAANWFHRRKPGL